MAHILKEEKIEAEPAALKLLGVGARGSMRDGLSLLDQAIAFAGDKPITLESVREMLGMMDSDVLIKLLGYLAEGNAHEMMKVAQQMSMRSLSFGQAIRDMASRFCIRSRLRSLTRQVLRPMIWIASRCSRWQKLSHRRKCSFTTRSRSMPEAT